MQISVGDLRSGTSIGQYTIVCKLGEGGFGAVYKVKAHHGGQLYALKVESFNAKMPILRIEAHLMELMIWHETAEKCNSTENYCKHFCRLEARGMTGDMCYTVMTLTGPSLQVWRQEFHHNDHVQDLRKQSPNRHFSLSTAIRVGSQCLSAINHLHRVGWLHRDIKGGNFAIGQPEIGQQRLIYMLDFGMARRFVNVDGAIRPPRRKAAFRGTVVYASLSSHLQALSFISFSPSQCVQRELSPRDDVESWLYMIIECTTGHLPWRMLRDKDTVGLAKLECRSEGTIMRTKLLDGCPKAYVKVLDYIDTRKYDNRFDYSQVQRLLSETLIQIDANAGSSLFDWEEKSDGKSTARRSKEQKRKL